VSPLSFAARSAGARFAPATVEPANIRPRRAAIGRGVPTLRHRRRNKRPTPVTRRRTGRLLRECLAIPGRLDTEALATIVDTVERASCWELVNDNLDPAANAMMRCGPRRSGWGLSVMAVT
jgi:hypothetical protein